MMDLLRRLEDETHSKHVKKKKKKEKEKKKQHTTTKTPNPLNVAVYDYTEIQGFLSHS